MKNTTLLSAIIILDLLHQAGSMAAFTDRPREVYTAIGLVLLIVLIPSNWHAGKLEGRAR